MNPFQSSNTSSRKQDELLLLVWTLDKLATLLLTAAVPERDLQREFGVCLRTSSVMSALRTHGESAEQLYRVIHFTSTRG